MVARWLVVVAVWTMLAGGIAGSTPEQASAELDRCELFLHEAISGHRVSDTLAALRELRDPALRGVFVAAATSSDPMPRAHSVLWLAELAEPPAIDVGLVLAMPTPREQATVLLHAAEHGLLSDEATAALLLADSLGPRIEVALLAQRIARGVGVDIERIEALTVHELPDVRFGALLLAMAADPVGPSLDRLDAELGKLDAQRRHGVCNYLLDFASTHRLGSIEPFLELMLIEFAGDPARHTRVIESLLEQRAGIAESEWLDAYDLAFSTAERVPLAIAALHTARGIGLAPFERLLASESELLVAIGAAGRSVAIGEPSIDTFQGLIETGLPSALTWAIEHAEMLGDEAAAFLLEIIDAASRRVSRRAPVGRGATLASRRLADLDAQALAAPLRRALDAGDEPMVLAIVLAHLHAGADPIWSSRSPPAWATDQIAALAALCRGRSVLPSGSVAQLTEAERAALAHAGLGRARLSHAHRVQSAWLALRAADRSFSPDPGASGPRSSSNADSPGITP